MALQDQGLAIALGQGVDTKTDPKGVVPGKLLRLENAIFTEAHQIAKRLGYTGLTSVTFDPYTGTNGTLVSPAMVKAYNNELILADNRRLYSYSPSLNAWVDKGPYESIIPTQQLVSANGSGSSQTFQSQASNGKYTVVTWQELHQTTNVQCVVACLIDNTTGAKVFPDTVLADGTMPTAVNASLNPAVDDLAVYMRGATTSDILYFYFIIVGSLITLAGPATIATDFAANPSYPSYDVAATTNGTVLSYSTSTALKTLEVSVGGGVTVTRTITTTCEAISVTTDSTGQAWVYFWDGSAAGSLYYAIYDINLNVVLAKTHLATLDTSYYCASIGAVSDSTTQQTIVYSETLSASGSGTETAVANRSLTATSTGTVAAAAFQSTSPIPISKPFIVNSNHYLLTLVPNGLSGDAFTTIFLFNMDQTVPAAGNVVGYAASKALDGSGANAANADVTPFGSGHLQQVIFYSPTKPSIAAGYISAEAPSTQYSTTTLTFDFNNPDAYQALAINNQLVLNGGVVQMYDGTANAELNFNNLPSMGGAFATGSGNVTILPEYIAVYQWTDKNDNLHTSGVSNIETASNTGTMPPYTVTGTVYTPIVTSKDLSDNSAPIVSIYTNNFVGDTNFWLLVSFDLLPGTTSVAFTDDTPEVTPGVRGLTDPLYINGGVLQNTAPPPCAAFNTHNNRLWCVDSTNNDTVQYSKTSQLQVGVSFAGDDLSVTCDAKGGPIAALGEMDDKEVLFKANDRIAILFGDGANDTGTGDTLSTPQFIQTDVGCSVPKSVIGQPNGLLFKSPKGWYQLDRSTQVSYIGAAVQEYNSQNVTSAVRLEDQTLCIFLTSSGLTLAYDYFFNQWSTFTNHTGFGADIFQGLYTYCRTDGTVFQQNETSYLDNAATFLVKAQTSWLRLDKVQGFQRIRKVLALGDHVSPLLGHGLQISAAYDFVPTFSTPVQYIFTNSTSTYQYREGLPRQKCDTVSLLIEEVSAAAGQTGEYVDLTDLGFEAAVKKGPAKLPASQSVG